MYEGDMAEWEMAEGDMYQWVGLLEFYVSLSQ